MFIIINMIFDRWCANEHRMDTLPCLTQSERGKNENDLDSMCVASVGQFKDKYMAKVRNIRETAEKLSPKLQNRITN